MTNNRIEYLEDIPLEAKLGIRSVAFVPSFSCKETLGLRHCEIDANGPYTDYFKCVSDCESGITQPIQATQPSQTTQPPVTTQPVVERYSCQEMAGIKYCGYDPNGPYTDYNQCLTECTGGMPTQPTFPTQPTGTYPTEPTGTYPTETQPTYPTETQPTYPTEPPQPGVERYSCQELAGMKYCGYDPNGPYTDYMQCLTDCTGGMPTEPTFPTQPTQPGERYTCKELEGYRFCDVDPNGEYSDYTSCALACEEGATQPTGTQPTGTQPTGTQPTGTQPTGTQPTGTQPTVPLGCKAGEIKIVNKCVNKNHLLIGAGVIGLSGAGYYVYKHYQKKGKANR